MVWTGTIKTNDGRSLLKNRGNDGNGTKKESGKKYKFKAYKKT